MFVGRRSKRPRTTGPLSVSSVAVASGIGRILKDYARRLCLTRGYSAHSIRATFITTALENGCSVEDVQRDASHADPSTTKLYDRRGYNPEKSASFFANY